MKGKSWKKIEFTKGKQNEEWRENLKKSDFKHVKNAEIQEVENSEREKIQ